MHVRALTLITTMAAIALALGACTAPEGEQTAPSASAPSSDLTPTGMVLAGATNGGSTQMVSDGAGAVWIRGPWTVTRLDPETGEATTWDASDDALFASPDLRLASTTGVGIWLMDGARVRRFDGDRFTADLQVPEELLVEGRAAGLDTRVWDVEEVGPEIWMSLEDVEAIWSPAEGRSGRVVSWSNGQWTAMSWRGDGASGFLASASDGAVWATGLVGLQDANLVQRWDGTAWAEAGPPDPERMILPVEVVADSTQGVWLLCQQCARLDGESLTGLLRFDGGSWRSVGGAEVSQLVWQTGYGTLDRTGWLVVSGDGDAWVAGEEGVARFSPGGTSQVFGAAQGIDYDVEASGNRILGIAVASDHIVVLDASGVLRLDSGQFTRVWREPSAALSNRHGLLATSSDEAWAVDSSDDAQRARLARYRDGAWEAMGPRVGRACSSTVVATDGAVWATTAEGLARFDGDDYRVVSQDVEGCLESAGSDGSVWLVEGSLYGHTEDSPGINDVVVGYGVDGSRTAIGRPEGFEIVCFMAAGADGFVWVSRGHLDAEDGGYRCPGEGEESYKGPGDEVAMWDGSTWTEFPAPPGMVGMAVSQGRTWAAGAYQGSSGWATGEQTWIDWYRFDEGTWALVAHDEGAPPVEAVHFFELSRPVLPTPDGGACAQAWGALACVDASGKVVRIDAVGAGVQTGVREFSIAPDGSVWVLGPQVASLAQALPAGD